MKKYELTEEVLKVSGRKLYRIRALVSFGDVTAGELGGYIQSEKNLSQEGNAWVAGDAQVCNKALVCGDALVRDRALVCNKVLVSDKALVSDNAQVFGDAWVCGNAKVYGNARVYGNAWVHGNARVFGNAEVCDNAAVYGNARAFHSVRVRDTAILLGDATIASNAHYVCIRGLGSENRKMTFFLCRDGHVHVKCGCFSGTLTEFENRVRGTHGDSRYAREYLACIEVVKIHFEEEENA